MTDRWTRFTIGLVFTAAAAYLLYRLRFVLVTVALAVMLAYAVSPLVELVTRVRLAGRALSRLAGVSAVFVLLTLLGAAVVKLSAGAVGNEVQRLAAYMPVYREELGRMLDDLLAVVDQNFSADFRQTVQDAFSRAGALLVDALAGFVGVTARWLIHVVELILIPLLAFYFLVDLPGFKQELMQFIPTSLRPKVTIAARHLDRIFAGYVRGQIILMVVAVAAVWGGLSVMHMPFPLVLALVAGIARAIPVVGPFLGTIPIVGLALLQSTSLGVEVLVFLLVLQVIESKAILPAVMGRQLDLRAATIILALLVGNVLFGLAGAFLAVPVAAAVKAILTLADHGFSEQA